MQRFAEYFSIRQDTTVLDMGGAHAIWAFMETRPKVTILDVHEPRNKASWAIYIVADGCDTGIPSHSFEVVFSNSVIEHVGSFDRQRQFAAECARCGRGYYVQTPNKWFPLDPHTFMLFAHWLPQRWYTKLMRISPRFLMTTPNPAEIEDQLNMRMLTKREMQELFPSAEIIEEKFLGLTKSLIAASQRRSDLY